MIGGTALQGPDAAQVLLCNIKTPDDAALLKRQCYGAKFETLGNHNLKDEDIFSAPHVVNRLSSHAAKRLDRHDGQRYGE